MMIKIIELLLLSISRLVKKAQDSLNNLNPVKTLNLLSVEYKSSGRYLIYTLQNPFLLTGKDLLFSLYRTLEDNEQFKEFGSKKIVITSAVRGSQKWSVHHNVLITKTTTFQDYYAQVQETFETHVHGYNLEEIIVLYRVKVWNLDHAKNAQITVHKNKFKKDLTNKPGTRGYKTLITPLKPSKNILIPKSITTMDIETITHNNYQVPIAISTAYNKNRRQIFIIDKDLLLKDVDEAVIDLFKTYLDYMVLNSKYFENGFAHNLGSFDGYFLYKNISRLVAPENVDTIIDAHNKFIMIKVVYKEKAFTWRDSYRIFPVSLEDLAKNFNVQGKISKYDERYNSLTLFDNENLFNGFIEYSLQDSVALLNALNEAQFIYIHKYQVDIATIVRTSSLSLKIFRKMFQNEIIPVLTPTVDKNIRKSYFGGATDYYKRYGEKVYYYDVNSLYPFAMLKDMPVTLLKEFIKPTFKLEEMFGFCEVVVTCPKDIKKPVLPHKYNGETIFPTGEWTGVYFTEELKAVSNLGYSFKILKYWQFSKSPLFNNYVNNFYEQKKNAKTPSERLIAKMHLNQLYGIFGRRLTQLKLLMFILKM